MRIALILPADVKVQGGVQRFGAALSEALKRIADVQEFRVHPSIAEGRSIAARTRSFARAYYSLWECHHRKRFDSVLSTFHWPPRLLPRVCTAGVVHDLRSLGLHTSDGFDRSRLSVRALSLKVSLASWDRIFVPTEHVATDVKRLAAPERVVTVGEGLDHLDEHFSALEGKPSRSRLVVIAGRSPHKRGALGLKVARRFVAATGAGATIIGQVAGELPEGIELLDRPDDRSLVFALHEARVALAPSSYEGFGLAVGEAMRCGVPVVYASDCPIKDLVGAGGVAAPPTEERMLDAVLAAWHAHEALSREARHQSDLYSWGTTAQRIVNSLRSVG